ncbi:MULTISPECIES: hypothetical protein [Desulfococcus]|jgi:hypothetical protein|uniref:Uncharacterized protein n=1 Tax=Desulfococcus multivorans DSM 2059 TaxID=1121405 RepID=S7UXB5_DESML|nr:hypothetical protein [Desulfococcus multivorans]AOY57755.1 uncharacterized protein Dmul_09800 [Desulfococcus multivorans]EPR38839.1 hypothetical protein dsmv_0249 [Desulfococcus multivorans DSM 2059]MDX9817509.1 hypothetical protein [Desulfococcus multivorans]SJZ80763.1 hypothetical protein SAMN02745446_01737 [Desulfococcus multivorans DSM 2059]
MHRLNVFSTLLIVIFAGVFVAGSGRATQLGEDNSYHHLPNLLRPSDQSPDFMALTDFEEDYEETVHNASLAYLNTHSKLIQRIRDDLGTRKIRWHLEKLSHRLLYAPENRGDVAELFADYCREVIEDLLARTGLVNPYCSISTIVEERPNLVDNQGVKAIIVQDLAREYIARYQFSGNDRKRIEISLSGRMTVNEVGSYASNLQYSEETHDWEFVRDRHTVWKSVSANPYTVLMTPLEETLHIALRKYTEKAIMDALVRKKESPSLPEIQQMMHEWLMVEEAIVGGLVYKLIPDVVIKRIPTLPMAWVHADLETKARFDKYRFLQQGIAVVESRGLRESIQLFAHDPTAFRTLLTEPS